MEKYVAMFVLLCLIGCRNNTGDDLEKHHAKIYNVKICYLGCFNERRSFADHLIESLSTDSLYLFIEKGFKNDLVTIYINNKVSFQDTLTTNAIVSSVGQYTFGPIENIKEISFRINNGNRATMEIDKDTRMLNLNYLDSTLIVSVLKHIPAYD